MSFAITSTAGSGLLTASAGGTTVSISGSSFSNVTHLNKRITVGSQTTFITSLVSASVANVSSAWASGFSNSAWSYQYLTQSGTDADYSGLATLNPTGLVTTSIIGTGNSVKKIYNISYWTLNVTGTLNHDPDKECILGFAAGPTIGFNTTSVNRSGIMLTISSGGTYNYGVTTTVNGVVRYSTGLGISNSTVAADPFTNACIEVKPNGVFNFRGGLIELASPIYVRSGGYFTVYKGTLYNKGASDYQIRVETTDTTTSSRVNIANLTLAGITNAMRLYTTFGYGSLTVNPDFANYQFNAAGSLAQNDQAIFTDWKNSLNAASADIIFNTNASTNIYRTTFRGYERQLVAAQQTAGTSGGLVAVQRPFTLTAKNAAQASIEGAVVYLKEIDNGNRTVINTIDTTPTVTTVGSTNASGQYSFTPTVENIWCAHGTSSITRDYRYNVDQSLNTSIWAYGYQYWSAVEEYRGTGIKTPTYSLIADTYVTLSESAAVAKLASSFTVSGTTVTVTANSTLDDLYDALMAYKTRPVAAQLETPTISSQLASASGTDLTGYTGWTLVVNIGVTLSAGTKLKRVLFDTVTNNGTISALYVNGDNPSARLTLNGVSGGNVVVFDNTGVVVDYADAVSSNYVMNIASGKTGTWNWIVEKYGYKRQSGTFTPGVGGDFSANIAYVEDINLTVTDQATVAAYSNLENPTKVFDYASYWRSSSNGIEFDLVSKAATLVDFGASSVTFTPFISAPSGAVGALVPIETPDGVVFLPQGTILGGPLYYEEGPDLFTICSGFNLAPASLVGFTTTGRVTIQELVNFTATMSGGILNLPVPATYTFGVNGSTLELNQTSASTYNLRGCTISGTIKIKNMSAFAMTVYLPNGTSYDLSENTGGTITIDDSVPVTITAPNLLSGSRVRLYNDTDDSELYNGVISSGGLSFAYSWLANKTITMTATYQAGTAAKLPVEATGVVTSSGLTFLGSQEDDTVYNGMGIDGDTITGFYADYVNDDVNITSGANFTMADLYAWWVHNTTLEEGIRNFVGGITAIDTANFKINTSIVDIYLDNTTSTSIYQTDNRRIYRSDGVYPVRVPTTGGGGIDVNWRDQVLFVQNDDIAAIKKNTDLIPALL